MPQSAELTMIYEEQPTNLPGSYSAAGTMYIKCGEGDEIAVPMCTNGPFNMDLDGMVAASGTPGPHDCFTPLPGQHPASVVIKERHSSGESAAASIRGPSFKRLERTCSIQSRVETVWFVIDTDSSTVFGLWGLGSVSDVSATVLSRL